MKRGLKTFLIAGVFSMMTASIFAQAPAFDLKKGTVKLNSGHEMPVLGIGTFQLSNSQAENSVYWALKAGMRLIDTARIYGNEEGVGRGIRRAIKDGICKREEIFVTTKMWTSDFSNGDAAVDASLKRLGLDYIDLMILHHSQPRNDVDAYKAMERAVKAGKLRSIGLSNYYEPDDFDRLVKATSIKPALLQNETHPYHQSGKMKAHIAKYGTVMESWFRRKPSACLPSLRVAETRTINFCEFAKGKLVKFAIANDAPAGRQHRNPRQLQRKAHHRRCKRLGFFPHRL